MKVRVGSNFPDDQERLFRRSGDGGAHRGRVAQKGWDLNGPLQAQRDGILALGGAAGLALRNPLMHKQPPDA